MSGPVSKREWRCSFRRIALGLFLLLVGAEGGARLLRVADVPLFWADPEIGYQPQPNQSGRFLWAHGWSFNEVAMRSGAYEPDRREADILLLGDSLVFGGNPMDQRETWGAQLEAALEGRGSVWAMGAPSWSSANEVSWLRRHPEILPKMEAVVWVLNSGDFEGRSQWSSSLDNPLVRPWSHAAWALMKYGVLRYHPQWRKPSPRDPAFPDGATVRVGWEGFLTQAAQKQRGLRWWIVLYPNQFELALPGSGPAWKEWCDGVRKMVERSGLPCAVKVLGEGEGWRPAYYRDFIHPNAAGNRWLGEKMAEWMRGTMFQGAAPAPAETR